MQSIPRRHLSQRSRGGVNGVMKGVTGAPGQGGGAGTGGRPTHSIAPVGRPEPETGGPPAGRLARPRAGRELRHRVVVVREQPARPFGTAGDGGTVFEVSDRGSARVGAAGRARPSRPSSSSSPARPGNTWTVAGFPTWTVGKEEEVEVPAGKYTAIPVSTELEVPGETGRGPCGLPPGSAWSRP